MEDYIDIILILLVVLLPVIAQLKVKSAYNKYSKVENSGNLTGKDVARMILDKNGLENVTISQISGDLTDHYSPKEKHINLSTKIYNDTSIASLAVAAHECGHAIQDKENYGFLRFRSAMVPVVNITSRIASIFILIGFISQIFDLLTIGILLLMVGLVFQFITLPVEFDASNRARLQLQSCGLITDTDIKGTKKVLSAAALTYVAGFLATALQILRLVLISRNRR